MAQVDESVMALVEAELAHTPTLGSRDLFEKMKAAVPSIGALTLRQFHARYPLQVKRKASLGKPRKKRKPPKTATPKRSPRRSTPPVAGGREAIRGVLMRFATELASAEAKPDVVRVLAGLDRYVDEIVELAAS